MIIIVRVNVDLQRRPIGFILNLEDDDTDDRWLCPKTVKVRKWYPKIRKWYTLRYILNQFQKKSCTLLLVFYIIRTGLICWAQRMWLISVSESSALLSLHSRAADFQIVTSLFLLLLHFLVSIEILIRSGREGQQTLPIEPINIEIYCRKYSPLGKIFKKLKMLLTII